MKGRVVISQQDLSARLAVMGISLDRTAISKIEAGQRQVLDYELLAVSRALGVSVNWLLSGHD